MLINLPQVENNDEMNEEFFNSRFNTIINLLNGELDADNLKNGAVTNAKLGAGAVTTDKVAAETLLPANIDSENWPAFRAIRTSNLNVTTSGVVIPFNTQEYNFGDYYDSSTGIFTAPYDGIYNFTTSVYTEAASTSRVFVNFTTSGTGSSANARVFDVQATRIFRGGGVWEGYLPQGGTIYVNAYSTTSVNINSTNTFFAGHLVSKVTV